MMRPGLFVICLVPLATACGGKSPAKSTAIAPRATPAATARAHEKPAESGRVPVSPNVAVSDDLAKRCGLTFANIERAPKFGLDDAELSAADRDVLQQVADCVLKGPLKGKTVQLIGRTDPRGTDEYNLGLGTRRADSVRSYLQRLGVPGQRLSSTTRGEIDASGADESGWQRDRRVDLQLVN